MKSCSASLSVLLLSGCSVFSGGISFELNSSDVGGVICAGSIDGSQATIYEVNSDGSQGARLERHLLRFSFEEEQEPTNSATPCELIQLLVPWFKMNQKLSNEY